MIGIELCQEAVEDAKVNAKLNGMMLNNIKQAVIGAVMFKWGSVFLLVCESGDL